MDASYKIKPLSRSIYAIQLKFKSINERHLNMRRIFPHKIENPTVKHFLRANISSASLANFPHPHTHKTAKKASAVSSPLHKLPSGNFRGEKRGRDVNNRKTSAVRRTVCANMEPFAYCEKHAGETRLMNYLCVFC